MGCIDFEVGPHHAEIIKGVLERYGFQFDDTEEWAIHGPHGPEKDYRIYVGNAIQSDGRSRCVAIYPHRNAVYTVVTS